MSGPRDEDDFGVDRDPYTDDDGMGQSSPPLPEPSENEPDLP